ncbi:MAG: hypothetical protein Q4F38_04905 [Akkermansia sp.]|nr:hypothetical protein [Akkermansia sp.]
MKHIFTLISGGMLLLSSIAPAQEGGFAKAAEFEAPRAELTPPQYLTPGDMRTWQLPSGPMKAAVVALEGEWGKNARVCLRSEYGLRLDVPARNMRDEDLEAVRQWIAANEFSELETLRHGKVLCKIRAITELSDYELMVHMVQPDGKLYHWPVYRKTLLPGERFDARPVPVTQSTLDMLHTRLLCQSELPPAPPTIAESVQEAAACAAIHGKSVVVLFLQQRGSRADANFRQYLKRYPYAAAHLSRRHVLLLAYMGADGTYPADLLRDITALGHQLAPTNNTPQQTPRQWQKEQPERTNGIHYMPHPYARRNEPNPSNCYAFSLHNDYFPAPEKLDFNLQ